MNELKTRADRFEEILKELGAENYSFRQRSFSVENEIDEISATGGHRFHSHSTLAGGLVVTSRTTRLTWGTSLTIREETRAIRS